MRSSGMQKELFAVIHLVDARLVKSRVQHAFESRRVLASDYGMDIETKGHRRIAEFFDAIFRDEAARHSDLQHIAAKRADVRDHIDIPGAGLLGHRKRALAFCFGVREAFSEFGQFGFKLRPVASAGMLGFDPRA